MEPVFPRVSFQLFRRSEDAEQAGFEAGKNRVESGFKKALGN